MTISFGRRDFITLLGGAAAVWPRAARAQQPNAVKRVGVLSQYVESEARAHTAVFRQRMQELGWTEGRNISYELRWGAGGLADRQKYARELVALAPDVILASSAVGVEALQELTRTIPIVFTGTIDPVGSGLVESLARPGGNATGFLTIEYGIGSKWLQILKEIAPEVTRVAVLRAPTIPGSGQFGAIQSVASAFGVEVRPVYSTLADEVERALTAYVRAPNGGLIATIAGIANTTIPDDVIPAIAARLRLPAVYHDRRFVHAGGLISYGSVRTEDYRNAAGYVDRILRGEKPADLPVQAPTRYETVLNLKAAKAIGLKVPDIVLLRADEVIE
jgi:putative tryptophan/tyrosine transport system substrate-binding protein